ncbi:hypothetical protein B0A55_05948 [Friedmanniomyces simplex]|uniref:Transcription elongation factor 1 homolog n=1 Tax=Friedmanniomyces simplex TaxID=329884 RepID=A0A4U0XDZ5_9PEZI|nr:hypothetical protein B0A55_05948 [Friedmanniomyces simplex]
MGKRKKSSRKPMGPKKRDPLATSFKCPFCDHESSVAVQIDKKNYIGVVDCRNCGQHYQSSSDMRSLMQAVDVYYEWIDACEDVNGPGAAASGANVGRPSASQPRQNAPVASRVGLAPGEKYTEEDRGFIDDADDVDAEAEYEEE